MSSMEIYNELVTKVKEASDGMSVDGLRFKAVKITNENMQNVMDAKMEGDGTISVMLTKCKIRNRRYNYRIHTMSDVKVVTRNYCS